jgi:H+-transporting ATPase
MFKQHVLNHTAAHKGEPAADQAVHQVDREERPTSPANGLTQAEAARRLEKYGYNELAEKATNPFLKFLSYFWGPIPWMIEIAAILSAVVRHWPDFGIIFALLLVNAVVGFWEEFQAGNAIAALKKNLALKARVKRDGAWIVVPARELVPGDRVRLRIGDIVPADVQLDGDGYLQIDESALTGESLPVTRKTGETAYSSAVIKQGEMDGAVAATGANTYFGKTARLVESAHTESHFQRALLQIGDYLIVFALILVTVILMVALFRGDPLLTTVQFALVLTVAAIPVAMPTVLSVTMAVGARLLAAKQAIVTRLSSIEELAGADVLCSDKTGTLTQNRLTLGDPFAVGGWTPAQTILMAALASRAEDQDTIDLAVIGGVKDQSQLAEYEITDFQPFDPVNKRTEATVKNHDGHTFRVSKGAPQVIMALAANAAQVQGKVEQAVETFASRGFRALGVARTNDQDAWEFIGVLPLYDPPREDSKATIDTARQMGVDVKMVTGDQIAIGREIARELGLGANLLDAGMFASTQHHEAAQLADNIDKADGFAQVFPEHKYHIVDVLQQRGHIVGMTGDGVNDAPALKKADVGIAVSGATDAARAAADIVLLTPGLSVIIDALKESRRIFERMNSYAIYRIAETIRVLLFMTFSILVFNFYPVTAVMIVLLALLNDGAILTIAYDRVEDSDRPEKWNLPVVLKLDQTFIQSLMYLKLSVAGHLTIFVTRTRRPFWSFRPSYKLLGAVLGTQTIATLITVYGVLMSPIGWTWAVLVWIYALAWLLVNDQIKLLAYRVFDRMQPGLLRRNHAPVQR